MILFFSSLVLLLYETASTNGCQYMYNKEEPVSFNTSIDNQLQVGDGITKCVFYLDGPPDHYVMLNFTNFVGLNTFPITNGLPSDPLLTRAQRTCLPQLLISEVMENGAERNAETLCVARNIVNPKVFHSISHIVKLIYQWDSTDSQNSGFTAQMRFVKWPNEGCKFRCSGGNCLPESSLVCNEIDDCGDWSDEKDCIQRSVTPETKSTLTDESHSLVEIVIIVIVVVITLAVIACVVLNCLLSNRIWGDHHRHLNSSADGNTLNSHSPRSTEVVYVPGSSMDSHLLPGDREALRDRQLRLYSPGRNSELNLPPHIPRSEDGEEGYAASQRLLQADSLMESENEAIRPPPNRTVFQGESPPPYRVQPNGKMASQHPPRKTDCSCGLPVAYHNNNDLSSVGSLPCTNTTIGPVLARNTRASLGNVHDNPIPRVRTPASSRSGANIRNNFTSGQSNQHNNGVSYGPPPDYSEVVSMPGSAGQPRLPDNSTNSAHDSNV